uniref:Neurobeachin alpha-solenoid region domain-containing protein n=1 Tax=Ditylenchus dipsaci TaxID=166011 RepID=A0A915DTL0_9BILA
MMDNTDSDAFESSETTSNIMISQAGSDVLNFPAPTSTMPVQSSIPTLTSFREKLNSSTDFDEEHGMEDIQLNDPSSKAPQNKPKKSDEQPETRAENKQMQQSRETQQTSPAENLEKDNYNQIPVTITVSKASDEESLAPTEPEANEELSTQFEHTTVIHSLEESAEDTFQRLKDGCVNGTLTQKEIVDGFLMWLVIVNLVGGPFDLESRFIIECSENVEKMLEFIEICPHGMQAEIWSVFVAIVRKSFRNLEACSRVGLISKCLERLPSADAIISDLLVQLLGVLTSYSITVKETKHLLRALHAKNGVWSKNSSKLLSVMQEMPKREGADVFFSFPGKAAAGISLPPLHRWPYQNGWTFSTWFRMDPLNSVNFEKEKPYLFSFLTAKGLGYQCYFMGNCLVLRCIRGPNKETTRCVKQELTPRKWHHVAISYVYSRWAKSEIHCYIDGQLLELVDASWVVSTSDYFDRCFIGCGTEPDVNEAFAVNWQLFMCSLSQLMCNKLLVFSVSDLPIKAISSMMLSPTSLRVIKSTF